MWSTTKDGALDTTVFEDMSLKRFRDDFGHGHSPPPRYTPPAPQQRVSLEKDSLVSATLCLVNDAEKEQQKQSQHGPDEAAGPEEACKRGEHGFFRVPDRIKKKAEAARARKAETHVKFPRLGSNTHRDAVEFETGVYSFSSS